MSAILLSTDGTHKVVDVREDILFNDFQELLECRTIEGIDIRDIDDRYVLELLVDKEFEYRKGNTLSVVVYTNNAPYYVLGNALLVKYDKVDKVYRGFTSSETAFLTNALTCNRELLDGMVKDVPILHTN